MFRLQSQANTIFTQSELEQPVLRSGHAIFQVISSCKYTLARLQCTQRMLTLARTYASKQKRNMLESFRKKNIDGTSGENHTGIHSANKTRRYTDKLQVQDNQK